MYLMQIISTLTFKKGTFQAKEKVLEKVAASLRVFQKPPLSVDRN